MTDDAHPAHRAMALVLAEEERDRQVRALGYTPARDAGYVNGELLAAATAYQLVGSPVLANVWPWPPETFKPRDRKDNLIRAAALCMAEQDRASTAYDVAHQAYMSGATRQHPGPRPPFITLARDKLNAVIDDLTSLLADEDRANG